MDVKISAVDFLTPSMVSLCCNLQLVLKMVMKQLHIHRELIFWHHIDRQFGYTSSHLISTMALGIDIIYLFFVWGLNSEVL